MKFLVAAALMFAAVPVLAGDPAAGEGIKWLERMGSAARTQNFSGTFVYQQGNRVDTSRITHYVDGGGNELEKLESLDGPEREIIRRNDEVRCYIPDSKLLKVEKRRGRKAFPDLLPEQVGELAEHYLVRLGGRERVAGIECQIVTLEPRDDMRYGHTLCADRDSGLLVKAVMLDENRQVVEQFAFTQLVIGGGVDPAHLKPRFAATPGEWREERVAPPVINETGWSIANSPPGFKKVMEMKRAIPGKGAEVTHIVLSDGLVAVSVFIEPLGGDKHPQSGFSRRGGINVFARPVSEHMVTVLGETPVSTVQLIGNSVSYSGR
jgi:sigma-E factor negative regulatory protein RseB